LDLCDRTATELAAMIRRGEITCQDLAESVLRRASRVEGALHAYLTLDADGARDRARALDAEMDVAKRTGQGGAPRGARGAERSAARGSGVYGIPIAVKDNICTEDLPTTCGSRILDGYVPPYDATAVSRLLRAGVVLTGKCNLDEFGMGSSTEHSCAGPTRNPWDLERVAGGSSGGSAAAVSAGAAVAALGSDTGGSVRLPAAFCGVTGFRPTYGAVSRYGLVAFASSMDQIGFIARDAADCAALLAAVSGPDGLDSTALPAPPEPAGGAFSLEGTTLGVPFSWVESGVSADAGTRFHEALQVFEGLGARVVSVDLMDPTLPLAAYYIIADCEASSNLARYDGVRYGARAPAGTFEDMVTETRSRFFGEEVKRRILLGTFALSAGYYDRYYLEAQRVRKLVSLDFERALAATRLLALPTAAGPAFRLGEKLEDPLSMYLEDIFTVGASLAGLPAVSVPMGFSREGLPLGLQLVGRRMADFELLEAASIYQRATGHHNARPPVAATAPGEE